MTYGTQVQFAAVVIVDERVNYSSRGVVLSICHSTALSIHFKDFDFSRTWSLLEGGRSKI
jgi:hypothetical protein